MGPIGTPSVKLQVLGRFHTPPFKRAGTIMSYTGSTVNTCLTIFAAYKKEVEGSIEERNVNDETLNTL